MNWLVNGAMAGAAIGLGAVAIVGTGGLAAAAIVGGLASGGAGIGEVLSAMSWAPKEVCGVIKGAGSNNVFINGIPAARAHVDVVECYKHSPPYPPIATGSATVYINGQPAARVDDKAVCSAAITSGSHDVFIGGDTTQTDVLEPENLVPAGVHAALLVVGIGSAIVLGGPIIAAVGLAGGTVGQLGGEWLGGETFGIGSDGQRWAMLGGSLLGGAVGAKGGAGIAGKWAAQPLLKAHRAMEEKTYVADLGAESSRGDFLRQKYGHLSSRERQAIIDNRLENLASDRLAKLEQSIPGAHFQGRHGAQTTLQQQYERAVNGIDPITNQVRYRADGSPVTPNSSKFMSARDQINAIERATNIYERTGSKVLAEHPIVFKTQAGEGYYGGTGLYDTSYSVQVWFNRTRKPITAFPILGQ